MSVTIPEEDVKAESTSVLIMGEGEFDNKYGCFLVEADICHTMIKLFNMVTTLEQGKLNVNLSLYLTMHHAMKLYKGTGGIAPRIL
jgi:hypothetical protein